MNLILCIGSFARIKVKKLEKSKKQQRVNANKFVSSVTVKKHRNKTQNFKLSKELKKYRMNNINNNYKILMGA
jgi:hypothetical protein